MVRRIQVTSVIKENVVKKKDKHTSPQLEFSVKFEKN